MAHDVNIIRSDNGLVDNEGRKTSAKSLIEGEATRDARSEPLVKTHGGTEPHFTSQDLSSHSGNAWRKMARSLTYDQLADSEGTQGDLTSIAQRAFEGDVASGHQNTRTARQAMEAIASKMRQQGVDIEIPSKDGEMSVDEFRDLLARHGKAMSRSEVLKLIKANSVGQALPGATSAEAGEEGLDLDGEHGKRSQHGRGFRSTSETLDQDLVGASDDTDKNTLKKFGLRKMAFNKAKQMAKADGSDTGSSMAGDLVETYDNAKTAGRVAKKAGDKLVRMAGRGSLTAQAASSTLNVTPQAAKAAASSKGALATLQAKANQSFARKAVAGAAGKYVHLTGAAKAAAAVKETWLAIKIFASGIVAAGLPGIMVAIVPLAVIIGISAALSFCTGFIAVVGDALQETAAAIGRVFSGASAGGSYQMVVDYAYEYLNGNTHYGYSTAGPHSGGACDCSGLVYNCYLYAGFPVEDWENGGTYDPLANRAGSRARYIFEDSRLQQVSFEEAIPGDIVYWGGHVAIYIGDGMTIEHDGSGSVRMHQAMRSWGTGGPYFLHWPGMGGTGASGNIPESENGLSIGIYGTREFDLSSSGTSNGLENPYGFPLNTTQREVQDLWRAAGCAHDSNGFCTLNGYMLIACTTTYGNEGDQIDWTFSDGTVLHTIMIDSKNPNDEGCTQWGHDNGQNVLEFCGTNAIGSDPYYVLGLHGQRVVSYANNGSVLA